MGPVHLEVDNDLHRLMAGAAAMQAKMKSAITAMSPRMSKGLMTPRLSMLLTPRTRGNLDEAVRATMPEKPALDEGPLAADASILERAAREAPMGMTREQLEGTQLTP